MQHHEFVIGGTFYTAVGTWRCTDIGTRTVSAILVAGPHARVEPRWLDGPPYGAPEKLFDEYDLAQCWLNDEAELRERALSTGVPGSTAQPSWPNLDKANPYGERVSRRDHCDEVDDEELALSIPIDMVSVMLRRRAELRGYQPDPYPMKRLRVDRGHGRERRRAYGARRGADGSWLIEVFHFGRQSLETIPETEWDGLPRTHHDTPFDVNEHEAYSES